MKTFFVMHAHFLLLTHQYFYKAIRLSLLELTVQFLRHLGTADLRGCQRIRSLVHDDCPTFQDRTSDTTHLKYRGSEASDEIDARDHEPVKINKLY